MSTNLREYETEIDAFPADDGDILGTPAADDGKEGVAGEGMALARRPSRRPSTTTLWG